MAFKEVTSGEWTYEKDGDSITGVLVRAEDNVGPNKCRLYHLENEEGKKSVWGSMILDQRMMYVKPGELIRITYKGLGEAAPPKNPPKIFKVEIDQ